MKRFRFRFRNNTLILCQPTPAIDEVPLADAESEVSDHPVCEDAELAANSANTDADDVQSSLDEAKAELH